MSGATPTTGCRSCGARELVEVCALGDQPLANALPAQPDRDGDRFPLTMALCTACGLAQLTVSVDPERLFADYAYFSAYSPAVGQNARQLVERVVSGRDLGADDLVVEAASNDGYLLRNYVAAGVPVLGVDPAANVAAVAEEAGVPTLVAFFGSDAARRLRAEGRTASVYHANNVLAHVPDLNGFVEGIRTILRDDGVAIIETPYLRELVEHLEYDTIYHEHLCYYSLTALDALFARHGLDIVDVELIELHGGSLRLFAVPAGAGERRVTVTEMLADEDRLGVARLSYFTDFAERVDSLRRRQRDLLTSLVADGASVAGYGAAAKATVALNAIGLGSETVSFVVDRSPYKMGRYIAGTDVPVLPVDALFERRPDYLVLFAWNFATEIMEQCTAYAEAGGRFIVPVPDVRIV